MPEEGHSGSTELAFPQALGPVFIALLIPCLALYFKVSPLGDTRIVALASCSHAANQVSGLHSSSDYSLVIK
jgi:hypothetical protein